MTKKVKKCDKGKKATVARNQNSIRAEWRKNLGRNQAQSGGQFSSDQTKPAVQFQAAAKSGCAEESSVSCGLVPVVIFTGDLSLRLI